ncbi:MAG: pantetheine-phosphate adenylyltransferase [Spirochaetales bacterium]|nr:pantetheine-phosphate adenylyltransferase [Spirochaetales bacterium]
MQAIFPGTFDPLTNGHLNLIERASRILERLLVVVSINHQKKTLFSADERVAFLKETVGHLSNVEVHQWDKLIVDFAEEKGINTLIRGVRAFTDFGYEFELSMVNRGINPRIETFLMPTDPRYFVLRSSAIKELVLLGCDVSTMVPPVVEKALKGRVASGTLS